MDGIPISVRGSTSIQFAMNSMEFEHEFVLVDHITAEAILGLDFLEGNKCVVDLCNKQVSIQDKVIPL